MSAETEPLVDIVFVGEVIYWRGPSPFFFVAIPSDQVGEIRCAAREASYGWGVVPVEATVGAIAFRTSLFPKDRGYLLPLKAPVRKAGDIALGDVIEVALRITVKPAG